VTGVFGTGGTELRPPPSLGGEDKRGLAGVTNHDGALVFVLDTSSMNDLTDPFAVEGSDQRAPAFGPPKGAST